LSSTATDDGVRVNGGVHALQLRGCWAACPLRKAVSSFDDGTRLALLFLMLWICDIQVVCARVEVTEPLRLVDSVTGQTTAAEVVMVF